MNRGGGNNLTVSGSRVNLLPPPSNNSGVVRVRSYVPPSIGSQASSAQASSAGPTFSVTGSRTPLILGQNNAGRPQLPRPGQQQQQQQFDAQRQERERQEAAFLLLVNGPASMSFLYY